MIGWSGTMGDSRYYAFIKQRKVQAGQSKPVVHVGGGIYVHPLWAKWFGKRR